MLLRRGRGERGDRDWRMATESGSVATGLSSSIRVTARATARTASNRCDTSAWELAS